MRWLLLLCLFALACGRTTRDVGSYTPTLDQQAHGGEAGASADAAPDNGSPRDLSKPWKSSGCGTAPPDNPLDERGYSSWQVQQRGATLSGENPALANVRQFSVHAPSDYDPNRPYRIVYLLRSACHGGTLVDTPVYDMANESLGGNAQTIYVDVAEPALDMNPHCYDTGTGTESLEYEAFDLIHSLVESRYCVDNNRIFVAGPRQGGALANMYGCYFGGIPDPARKLSPKWAIRGHAVVDGWREANQPLPCSGPDAAIWIQETDDVESGMYDGSSPAALTLGLHDNGCSGSYDDGPKQAWPLADHVAGIQPGDCQVYTGCSSRTLADYPLVFCRVSGSGSDNRADLAIPAFTAFFDSMDPAP